MQMHEICYGPSGKAWVITCYLLVAYLETDLPMDTEAHHTFIGS